MRPTHLETRYRYELTPRQREVMDFLQRGLTNAEIAERLGVTLDGAKYHVREILGKLGAESREEAVAMWREMPSRARPWERFGLAFVVAGAAAAVAVTVAAVVLAMLARDGSDQAVIDATPVPATPTTTPPSPTAQPLADCTSLDATLTLETIPRDDDVLVRVSASGVTPCRMSGVFTLWLIRPPVTPVPDYPPEANVWREMSVDLEFPFGGVIGEWSWRNWCAEPMTFLIWQAKGPGGSVQVGLNTDFWPPCIEPDQPTWLERESFSNSLGGDPTPDPLCLTTDVPEWLCTFATSVALDQLAGPHALFRKRMSNDAFYLCDGLGGALGLPANSEICDGHEANTSVLGFWRSGPGGPDTFVAPDVLETELATLQPGPRAVSAAGCLPDRGWSCGLFAIALDGSTGPAVAFIFRLERGREPAIIGAALLEVGALPASLETPFGEFALAVLP